MKRHIKNILFTLIEAAILIFGLLALFCYLDWPIPEEAVTVCIYLVLVILLVFIKRQLLKLRRFFVLHFTLKRIDKMAGKDFEKYLESRFEKLGFQVSLTKDSGDYGADLILEKRNLTVAVQAKRHHGYVGIKAVQEVIGSMAYYHAAKGMVVTNSYYTNSARQLALANNVILWDRDILLRMAADENMSPYLSQLKR